MATTVVGVRKERCHEIANLTCLPMRRVTFCKFQTALPSPLALPSLHYSPERLTLRYFGRPLMVATPVASAFPPQHQERRATSATRHSRAPAATVRIPALRPNLLHLDPRLHPHRRVCGARGVRVWKRA
jgi:hypothetical protein